MVIVLLIPCKAGAQDPMLPKKYALVIGIDNYRFAIQGIPTLRFAAADATALAQALKDQNFEVVTLLNREAEREEIITELNRLAFVVNKDDMFLLFFAGHGLRNQIINNKTYWLTFDTELSKLDVNGIRLEHLMDYVQDLKATRKLVLLDHCFSGDIVKVGSTEFAANRGVGTSAGATSADSNSTAAAREVGGDIGVQRNVVPANFSQQIQSNTAGIVVIAAAHNEALESERLGHGVFTSVLLSALTSRKADVITKDGKLSIEELKTYLNAEVPRVAQEVAGFNQRVTDFSQGIDLNNWNLTEHLPVDNLADAKQESEQYRRTLDNWAAKGWITIPTKVTCNLVLIDWTQKLESGQSLEGDNKEILEEIRAHMRLSAFPEDLRARDLNEEVTRRLGS